MRKFKSTKGTMYFTRLPLRGYLEYTTEQLWPAVMPRFDKQEVPNKDVDEDEDDDEDEAYKVESHERDAEDEEEVENGEEGEEEACEIGEKSDKPDGGEDGDINYNPCGETSRSKCPNCRIDGKRKESHTSTCPISPARLLLAYVAIRKIPGRELCLHVDCDGTKGTSHHTKRCAKSNKWKDGRRYFFASSGSETPTSSGGAAA